MCHGSDFKEKQAHELLTNGKYEEAFKLYKQVADSHVKSGKHKAAALNLASAASCFAIHAGERTFYQAALTYEKASKQAEKSGDLEYTSVLYKQAAICYERDAEYMNFSECFFRSKEYYRKFLFSCLFNPKRNPFLKKSKDFSGSKGFIRKIVLWLALTFSSIIWGHGERPQRTVFFGVYFILFFAVLFPLGQVLKAGQIIQPSFFQSVYLSVITFTTVGYGDITPVGFNKLLVVVESFGGLFIVPIFITGLCRKYLRF